MQELNRVLASSTTLHESRKKQKSTNGELPKGPGKENTRILAPATVKVTVAMPTMSVISCVKTNLKSRKHVILIQFPPFVQVCSVVHQ